VQLPPGDPDHAPSGHFEAAVAQAVVLERDAGVVKGAAIELDEEALLRPGAVDLDALDEDVGLGCREARVDEKGEEELLELATGDGQASLCFFNYGSNDWDAGLSGVALDEVAEPEAVGEPELLGLPHRAAELGVLDDRTDVQQRAWHGRDPDAVMNGDLVVREIGPVELDSFRAAP
jgi:hypothetical protein